MENEKIKFWLEKYEALTGCNCYEVYFNVKHTIYKIELKTLPIEIVKLGRESSSKGGHEKLRLYISSKIKKEWVELGQAKEMMTEEKLIKLAEKLEINKGQACEYLSCKARRIEYTLDSVRFDKQGDVNLKRKRIQVKYENASLTQLRTIAKVASEN